VDERPSTRAHPTDATHAESLRAVRRAHVGRWWVQIKPVAGGFRAEAHTVSGDPAVWAGDVRERLADATADAVAMLPEFRLL